MRRRLMMQCAETKVNCVTSIVNPCAFDSTGERSVVECVYANLETGKTYKVVVKATITVTDKVAGSLSDMYIKYYPTWHNEINYRAVNIGIGITVMDETHESVMCYKGGENVIALVIDSTNVAGNVTFNEVTITEV